MAETEEDLSFETLLKLRDEVGLKTFQQFEAEKFFKNNKQTSKQKKVKETKIENEDDSDEPPEEISSKRPFKKNKHKHRIETRTIDPRFSDRSGKFNEEIFKKNFQFAFDLREKEVQALKEEQDDNNEKRSFKKKYVIQRFENQKREHLKRKKAPVNKKAVEVLPDGTKFYKSRKVQRTEELVNKFIELKKSGQLEKHLDKRRKKIAGKERKKMNIEK